MSYTKWKKWFAWYPVETIEGKHVWLKIIERRKNFMDEEEIMAFEKKNNTFLSGFEIAAMEIIEYR